MPIELLMPALSPTMTEGNLARWLKKEGDHIAAGEVIAEIETDKATMEVEAVDEGTLGRIVVAEGSEGVPVNAVIGLILEDGEDSSALEGFKAKAPAKAEAPAAAPKDEPSAPAPAEKPPAAEAPAAKAPAAQAAAAPAARAGNGADSGRIFASPLAKRMAGQAGLDLAALHGSGPRGRIVKADIERALKEGLPAKAPAAAEARAPQAEAPAAPKPAAPPPAAPVAPPAAAYTELPLSNMRKVIARRLTEAKQTIPHFYLTVDCTLDTLLALRKELNERTGADYKLSVNDFVIKAAALALRKVPTANVSFGGDKIYQYHDVDIGVAVAIPDGLVTPVIRKADQKGLATISAEMRDLSARARDPGGMKLKPEEYQGGALSVSNLGMYGVREFAAVINPPQSGILAVGAGEQRAVVREGALAIATIMTATLSTDHRAVDGALGAQLLAAFKGYIEEPLAMML
jgi:pyruvate dehydrogenase E2 component (dihydrolipoamide acetyltransferase)